MRLIKKLQLSNDLTYNEIKTICMTNNIKYIDLSFPPTNNSLYGTKNNMNNNNTSISQSIVWHRPTYV
jgi:hypothetical protein